MWNREGFFYVARLQCIRGSQRWTVEKRLDFFSYHLIRWFHGDEALREMAMKVRLE